MDHFKIHNAINFIDASYLTSLLEGYEEHKKGFKELPKDFQFFDMYQNGYNLRNQESYTNIVLIHLPSGTHWQIEVSFDLSGKYKISSRWQRVIPRYQRIMKTTYNPVYD